MTQSKFNQQYQNQIHKDHHDLMLSNSASNEWISFALRDQRGQHFGWRYDLKKQDITIK